MLIKTGDDSESKILNIIKTDEELDEEKKKIEKSKDEEKKNSVK